jgi:hypothetical protein
VSSGSGGRGLPPRSRWVGVAFIGGLLLLALIFTRTCGSQDNLVSDDQAVAAARAEIDFEPERTSVRFLRQGIPSRPYYGVSFSAGTQGQPGYRVTTVLVDARSGEVTEVNREA